MPYTPSTRFHGYYDTKVLPFVDVKPYWIPIFLNLPVHVSILTRKLSYRFYPHFHPYVKELDKRLIEGSVRGLQAADTEWGTPARLSNQTQAGLPGEAPQPVTLSAGEVIRLPDGAVITSSDGTSAKYWGNLLIKPSDGSSVTLPDNAQVTLPARTLVRRASGASVVLTSDTPAILVSGQPRLTLYQEIFSPSRYNPNPELVDERHPVKDLDFASSGAYSVYNWELFFHVPFSVAVNLSKNQRFDEAMHWFHYIFDPTDDSDGPSPERFWKVKPFQYSDVKRIEDILVNLSTGADPQLRQDTINSIAAWKDAPFRPHLVARYRQSAYMFKTVMAYLDNLIDWGDSLFRQDTGESIDEAMQLYVLAANILGPRPQAVPKKGSVRPQTYANLKKDLKEFGTVLVKFETDIPFDNTPHPNEASDLDRFSTLRSIGRALYFCVPRNDKLLSYWDTIADRLFKIRNSLNIQGIFRQLPLFEPPIDPGLLAKAAAAGLDVGAIVSGVNQPLPLVRFQLLVQKAAEICQEVKSLGNNLLSAIEKEDNEAFAILRAKHERVILGLAETVRYSQWQEAIKAKEGLFKSLALAAQRYTYYERQLGRKPDEIQKAIPELDELDNDSMVKMKSAMKEPEVALREIKVDIATDVAAEAAQALNGGKILSSHEVRESLFLEGAQLSSDIANILNIVSSTAHFVPTFTINVQPFGAGGTTQYGGKNVGDAVGATAAAARAVADRLNFEARRAGRIDSFARREREWAFQSNSAAGEITQIFKQLRAAQIREAIAEQEWNNHQQQVKHAQEIEYFLTGEKNPDWTRKIDPKEKKTANKALYAWMKREVKGLYGQVFQFSFDIAKKAERALQHELGNPELSFLQFGYLAGKEGLLAGEKLYLDIKRMEMAYHDLNQREYELTKHASLLQVNPLALLQLRTTGRCTVVLPEELFDMDGPGHYFRRIKSVAVSIPCVAGPYTSVNCTLTLLKSSIRKSPLVGDDGYARTGAEDSRFSDHFGSLQSIVTSTGQNDSGLFETNLRDERYLPFEWSGVVSEWQLELPANPSKNDPRQFDYDTIADVILHLRYTAREGGGLLRNGAVDNLKKRIKEATAAGSVRLFSIRHEFPTEWTKFKSVKIAGATKFAGLTLAFGDEHYPFWSKGLLEALKRVDLFAEPTKDTKTTITVSNKLTDEPVGTRKEDSIAKDTSFGGLRVGKLTNIPLPAPIGTLTLYFNDNSMENLWLALTWGKGN